MSAKGVSIEDAKRQVELTSRRLGLLHLAFAGLDKDSLLTSTDYVPDTKKVTAISTGEYLKKEREQIKGSGYVIDCLEAALWCFAHTDNYRDAILAAANLGDDADTTAAVCGQIAGAFYGVEGIPESWREKITMQEDILVLSERLNRENR